MRGAIGFVGYLFVGRGVFGNFLYTENNAAAVMAAIVYHKSTETRKMCMLVIS